MQQERQISLYFREGSSDKVYHAQLKAADGGFVVNFQYGRRGSALASGSKTSAPVEYGRAEKIYEKLVTEKTSKGYTPAESGVAYQDTAHAGRVSGCLPMLLNPIEEADLATYLDDPAWGMQVKADGERRMIRKIGGEVVGINRKGLFVNLPQPVAATIAALPFDQLLLDGEDMGDGGYVAFDLLERDGLDLRRMSCLSRHSSLLSVVSALPRGCTSIMATTMIVDGDKRAAIGRLRGSGEEGVVFKRLISHYTPSRPDSGGDALKFKFVESATVEIEGHSDGKRSVALRVYDTDGKPISVGRVTVSANQEVPAIGAICEVRYLYAYPGGSLFQPVFLGVRYDQDRADCRLSQLKLKTSSIPAAA